jgi:hypothetical protein
VAQPASYPVNTKDYIPGVKWKEHEADHSPHLVPRFKMDGAMPPQLHVLNKKIYKGDNFGIKKFHIQ